MFSALSQAFTALFASILSDIPGAMTDVLNSAPEQAIQVAEVAPLAPAKPSLEAALEQLRATNELLQRRKADAERDRELFRDLYNKASSHASEVSKENEELQERVTIAEGQVKDGIAMIRKTYEERVANLVAENCRLRNTNAIMLKKEVMTDGADIRRRAAEGEELMGENQKLRAELAQLRMDYHRMERLVEQLGQGESEPLSEQEEMLRDTAGVAMSSSPADDRTTSTESDVTVEHIQ